MSLLIFVFAVAYYRNSWEVDDKNLTKIKKRPNVAISYSKNNKFHLPIKTSKEILSEIQNSERLIQAIDEEELNEKIEMTLLSDNIIKKIDIFDWKDEPRKMKFIKEVIALTPEDREDIIEYMLEKSMEG